MFIGLMSGTSIDAIDGVLADFDADGAGRTAGAAVRAPVFASCPIPGPLRNELLSLQAPGPNELERAALAAIRLTDLYAEVVAQLLEQARQQDDMATDPTARVRRRVEAIGAHGQTVRHRPELGFTLQLIDGARLAEATGLPVVCDFRSADVAAGGQGAPLVPAFHALAFGDRRTRRAIVNIGGIANVSLIAGDDDPSVADGRIDVTGYDTGPGNVLMDAWCERHRGERFDRDGAWAASGKVAPSLLQRMLADPFFSRPAPKSTGRDLFTHHWLDRVLHSHGSQCGVAIGPADVQATLCELSASTIAAACRAFSAAQVWVCGGGTLNRHLMQRLSALAAPASVETTSVLGLAPQAVEATAFAWLAMRRMRGLPANLPAVTGARGPRVLGALYPAP